MFYIVNATDQQIVEFLETRPTLQHVGELARADRIDLYVIEGELAGITYTHVEDDPSPSADEIKTAPAWQRTLGYDAWKLEKESREGLDQ